MTSFDRRALFTSGAAAALLTAAGLSPERSPQKGGRLRLALARETRSLDLVTRGAVFDSLTEIGPDGLLRGELARNWQADDNAQVWTFNIRNSVWFHDATPATAKDVVASFRARDLLSDTGIALIEATGDHRVRIELASGNPDLPYLLAGTQFAICPAGRAGEGFDHGVGTGLYRMARSEPGRHFLGRRVDEHYKNESAGWFDSVDAVVIPDPAIRAEALRDGYVDVAELPEVAALRNMDAFTCLPSATDAVLVARKNVAVPRIVGKRGILDDGRLTERWWFA